MGVCGGAPFQRPHSTQEWSAAGGTRSKENKSVQTETQEVCETSVSIVTEDKSVQATNERTTGKEDRPRRRPTGPVVKKMVTGSKDLGAAGTVGKSPIQRHVGETRGGT